MKRRDSLIGQVVAVNVLLVLATLFAASAAAGLNLTLYDERYRFLLLALAIVLLLLVNMVMLRRRFSPLERLIERVEAIDPAQPSELVPPGDAGAPAEVGRLAASFQRLLERIEAERRRRGQAVLRAQEEERKRVARDLHDEVNQSLTAILLRLEALSHGAPPELADELAEVKRLANQAMEELLQLARQLRPTALDDHGLVPAIAGQVRRFASQTGIQADLDTHGEPAAVGDEQQLVVYRVAQEALANVARHSGATRVELELAAKDGGVRLRVRDDGRGFTAADAGHGLGLAGMAERARLVGGELEINSAPGRGTALTLQIP